MIRINDQSGGFKDASQILNLSDLYGVDESLVSDLQAHSIVEPTILDLNQDGFNDLIVVFSEGLSIFLNDASGGFYHLNNQIITGFSAEGLKAYASDLDADLRPEIVINTIAGTKVIYFSDNFSIEIISISNQSDWLATVDYDQDGDLDFLEQAFFDVCSTPSFEPEPSTYWINNGNGVFNSKVVAASGSTFNPIIIEPIVVAPLEIEDPVI